jgi:carbonic anhydrase
VSLQGCASCFHDGFPVDFVQILRVFRLEESVREDLNFLTSEPLVRQELKDNAKGYVYDIKTGKLKPVVCEP